ncbi:MAG TPA: hypothetical protein VFA41_18505 [Ktedonobacteraceae bacterium]|nr:hypothetical protein [Ktedonobacteraceae bacterium]
MNVVKITGHIFCRDALHRVLLRASAREAGRDEARPYRNVSQVVDTFFTAFCGVNGCS